MLPSSRMKMMRIRRKIVRMKVRMNRVKTVSMMMMRMMTVKILKTVKMRKEMKLVVMRKARMKMMRN